jgi:hypothetical protein
MLHSPLALLHAAAALPARSTAKTETHTRHTHLQPNTKPHCGVPTTGRSGLASEDGTVRREMVATGEVSQTPRATCATVYSRVGRLLALVWGPLKR